MDTFKLPDSGSNSHGPQVLATRFRAAVLRAPCVVSEGESASVVQTWDTAFVARVSVATHCAPPKGKTTEKERKREKKGQRTKKKKG